MYKVLIVDDEYWMCKGLEKVITRDCDGFEVGAFAKDGKEALACMQRQRFDVVFTDIAMPVLDGLEMIHLMREREIETPVIIITGYNEFEYARRAMRYDVKDYLLKPLDRVEVLKSLQRLRLEATPAHEEQISKATEQFTGKELISHVLKRIQTAYMEDLALTIIADETGYNPSYLSRLFKIETGVSFVKFLNEVRLREARKLLIQSNTRISEIAINTGFWDEKYFSRFFKRETGMSPTEYRHHKIQT